MTRPTKEQVDADIDQAEYLTGAADRAQRLAAEVVELREELADALGGIEVYGSAAEDLKAIIERVEALPAKWRVPELEGSAYGCNHCADELEAALKGGK